MPTIGSFHSKYWMFSDTNSAPIRISGGGYPSWQAGVITPSLFGAIGAWIDTHWALLKWHWALAKRVHRLKPESRALIMFTLTTLESPLYPKAQAAVRVTARTLAFGKDPVFKDVGRYMKTEPGRVENIYRHLHACRTLGQTAGSTMTNPQQNFLTELAYQGFTLNPRGPY